MWTSHRVTIFDRSVDWILDHDGDIYGDERERLRWYESIAVSASIQWLVVPWVLAVLVWVGGRDQVGYLVVLAVAFYLPMLISTFYVSSRKVRLVSRWNRKRVAISLLAGLPYALFFLGALRAYEGGGLDPGGVVGGVIGGIVGLALAIVGLRRTQQRQTREAALAEDVD